MQTDDADLLLPLWNDEIMVHLFKETIADLAQKALMFCIVEEKEGAAFVGLVGYMPPPDFRNRRTSMSIAFLPQFWNKGYGTEAINFMLTHGFKQLGLHRIALQVYEFNEHAVEVYRRLGFVEEGRAREAIWYDGRWWDIIEFGMLEREWGVSKRSPNDT
ncbi:acyl-CoA N-acyltransferase, partial [Cyathus striatus]